MFTGLVEGLGSVVETQAEADAIRLSIEVPEKWIAAIQIGDSVAINGCCLTTVVQRGLRCEFLAGNETLSRTNLGRISVGDVVNLERPLSIEGRLGGHFVQGHVDDQGTVHTVDCVGDWTTMWFEVPRRCAQLIVPKGSVAVDGVSLTVVDVTAERFSVALIPHTLEVTTLGRRQVGDSVNIENDILGKYVQRLLSGQLEPDA
ncbi:MAG: riboflavin synthase [Planctomycetaceae bacterium]